MQPGKSVQTSPNPAKPGHARRALVARVHIARKEMALADEAYRDILDRLFQVRSAGDCTDGQLQMLIAEFRRLGWKPRTPNRASPHPHVRLIYALWTELRPYLRDGSTEALRAFVRRQTQSVLKPQGVSAPEWLDGTQANKVTEGLKAWLQRAKQGDA